MCSGAMLTCSKSRSCMKRAIAAGDRRRPRPTNSSRLKCGRRTSRRARRRVMRDAARRTARAACGRSGRPEHDVGLSPNRRRRHAAAERARPAPRSVGTPRRSRRAFDVASRYGRHAHAAARFAQREVHRARSPARPSSRADRRARRNLGQPPRHVVRRATESRGTCRPPARCGTACPRICEPLDHRAAARVSSSPAALRISAATTSPSARARSTTGPSAAIACRCSPRS